MGIKEFKPAVEHGVRDVKHGTEPSDRISSGKILSNDTEDEKEDVSVVGNDQIRENGMGMAVAAIDHTEDADLVVNRPAVYGWSREQKKTCSKVRRVKIDDMKEMSNLICGKVDVGGNYNLTRNS